MYIKCRNTLFLLLFAALPITSVADNNGIDGFGNYKFGMTLEEAMKVREDDKLTDCEYENVFKCLEYKSTFNGEDANIAVLFPNSTKKVERIIVQFERIEDREPEACTNVIDTILPVLRKKYGSGDNVRLDDENKSLVWSQPNGASITLTQFCITKDTGIVLVLYKKEDSL